MDVLRFSTAGSVDDGKSTLIGRLLYDLGSVFDDQLADARRASRGETVDLALLTDGLRAEREQGITIDVAYRYFATPRRKFIIADTPGHEQYTRNMATGASTADAAVILVDARKGISVQSRRHAYIAHLLGIPHLVLAVNKMDQVGYARAVFDAIREEFADFVQRLGGRHTFTAIPLSALHGDNVVFRSTAMDWYPGPSLLEHLEAIELVEDAHEEFRFPVQLALRPNHEFRGFAGQVAGGSVHLGMPVTVLPSGQRTRVRRIHTASGGLPRAHAPLSVTLVLEDEIDVARGDMLVQSDHLPAVTRRFDADLVWMDSRPLEEGRNYLIKHTTRTVRATLALHHRTDVNTLERHPADHLKLNEIGRVSVYTRQPLMLDTYAANRRTGAFIVIDLETDRTVAAGMVTSILDEDAPQRALHGLWLQGDDATLRDAVADHLERTLQRQGHAALVLRDEDLKDGLNADLGREPGERAEASRRVLEVVRLLGRAGVSVVVAASSVDAPLALAPDIVSINLTEAQNAETAANDAWLRYTAALHAATSLGRPPT